MGRQNAFCLHMFGTHQCEQSFAPGHPVRQVSHRVSRVALSVRHPILVLT